MTEAVGYREGQSAKPNVQNLIAGRLGIGFENPPREIPLTVLNTINHPLLYLDALGMHGAYFYTTNTFVYQTGLGDDELRVRLHEATHALFEGVNPDYRETVEGLRDSVRASVAKIVIDHVRYNWFQKPDTRDKSETIRIQKLLNVAGMMQEGIAEWVSVETEKLNGEVTIQDHLDRLAKRTSDLEEQKMKIFKDSLVFRENIEALERYRAFYIEGHIFVQGVIDFLTQRGMSKGEALTRLMLCPALLPEEVEMGGAQYAQQNLI